MRTAMSWREKENSHWPLQRPPMVPILHRTNASLLRRPVFCLPPSIFSRFPGGHISLLISAPCTEYPQSWVVWLTNTLIICPQLPGSKKALDFPTQEEPTSPRDTQTTSPCLQAFPQHCVCSSKDARGGTSAEVGRRTGKRKGRNLTTA